MQGDELRQAREALGFSRQEMAATVDGTVGGIWSLENGKQPRDAGLQARVDEWFNGSEAAGEGAPPVPKLMIPAGFVVEERWQGLEPGVVVRVQGQEGSFRFIRHVVTDKGKTWVDVIGGRRGRNEFRSFRPELIITRRRSKA